MGKQPPRALHDREAGSPQADTPLGSVSIGPPRPHHRLVHLLRRAGSAASDLYSSFPPCANESLSTRGARTIPKRRSPSITVFPLPVPQRAAYAGDRTSLPGRDPLPASLPTNRGHHMPDQLPPTDRQAARPASRVTTPVPSPAIGGTSKGRHGRTCQDCHPMSSSAPSSPWSPRLGSRLPLG